MITTKDLDVYKLAHKVTMQVYELTKLFPKDEIYGLTSQMRRAAVSINSNLVEGGGRKTDGERWQFVGIARGSACELQYQVEVAKDFGYISNDTAKGIVENLDRVIRMLSGLMKAKRPVSVSLSESDQ